MARAYFWDVETGIFLGSREAKSLASNSTFDPPPVSSPGFALVREADSWQVKENHRGETVYSTVDGAPFEIELIGPIPDGYTTEIRPGTFWTWDGTAWEFQLQDRRQAMAELLTGLATQILVLSDLIIHEWEEQGTSGAYTEAEYDAEIAKRVTLRNGLTSRFAQIMAAVTPGEFDALEADFRELYLAQLRIYAQDRLSRA